MTDTMLFGVLKMPFEMAMKDEISRIQYYARVQELVGRFEAQQQAEPVPRWDVDEDNPDSLAKHPAFRATPKQQAEPVEEHITHITWDERGVRTVNGIPDDAPQRQWVGLTDEDFLEACQIAERGNYLVAFQRIQTKLKERNT